MDSGGGGDDGDTRDTVGQICCGGYVFYMSDGSPFRRLDVEPVATTAAAALKQESRLQPRLNDSRKRKRGESTGTENIAVNGSVVDLGPQGVDELYFHICGVDEITQPVTSVHLGETCPSWSTLSLDQKEALLKLRTRVDSDRADNNPFTCAIIEGPGGCGKTRLMAHIMNHSRANSLVLYVTKQNKRVQDFVHTDCLGGEPDPNVEKPNDLTSKKAYEIRAILEKRYAAGRFAVTAEKLVYAIACLSPKAFDRNATVSSLGMEDDLVTMKEEENCLAVQQGGIGRNVIVLMDEYTMLQPPLIHAIVYYLRQITNSSMVLLMGGDRYQCGPVGWNNTDTPPGAHYYSADVRKEIIAKLNYNPVELSMENVQRCRGDPALGACIRRLRRVCGEMPPSFEGRNSVNRVLAMYCAETAVGLYRKVTGTNGLSDIRKVVATDYEVLLDDCHTSTKDFDERMSLVDKEDLDTRGVELVLCTDEPTRPMYDLLPLVRHYTRLFVRLAEMDMTRRPNSVADLWPSAVDESVTTVRHLFPAVLVLTNSLCNVFAETFLLALSTQVRECVLNSPVPSELADSISSQTWITHLRSTLRRCIRSLTIDRDDAIQRQTLFLGMVYKMTSTFNATESGTGLCNGEIVVLTNMVFDSGNELDRINSVMLRKLDRNNTSDGDLVIRTGHNENRMTGTKKVAIMPFVPYVSENIYQMQGNTIGRNAKTFVDLANVPCRSAYVAVSRFQDSTSIQGIVVAD